MRHDAVLHPRDFRCVGRVNAEHPVRAERREDRRSEGRMVADQGQRVIDYFCNLYSRGANARSLPKFVAC